MLKSAAVNLGEKLYRKLRPKLAEKYDPETYVVINPKSGEYVTAETSVEAMKKARAAYPKGKLFIAQVGRIAGLLK